MHAFLQDNLRLTRCVYVKVLHTSCFLLTIRRNWSTAGNIMSNSIHTGK